jgi:hypothetical protein
MAARLPGTQVIRIRPGELGDPPAGINPLEPAPGSDGARFPLQTHADLVRALFLAAFEIPGRIRSRRAVPAGPGRGADPVL